MDTIIEKIEDVLEWLSSALQRLKKWWNRKQEEKRRKEIEKLVVKLWRMSAIYKCDVHELKYIEKYDNPVYKHYWIVDYHHKYIFGRED